MNIELNFPPNFEGLVLGCIDPDFCKYILVGKLSPRSTQCTPLHRSSISKFQPKIVNIFSRLNIEFPIFSFSSSNFAFFCEFLMNFFPDFAPNSRKEWGLSLFNQFCENELENCRNNYFWNLWKFVNSIQYYSIVSFFSVNFSAADWCGRVEDLQVWSSPTIQSTPPCLLCPFGLARIAILYENK